MYTVRLIKWGEIRNVIHTTDMSKAIKYEQYLANIYGKDKVWICDHFVEMMVG